MGKVRVGRGFTSFLKSYRPKRATVFTEGEFGTKEIEGTEVAFPTTPFEASNPQPAPSHKHCGCLAHLLSRNLSWKNQLKESYGYARIPLGMEATEGKAAPAPRELAKLPQGIHLNSPPAERGRKIWGKKGGM